MTLRRPSTRVAIALLVAGGLAACNGEFHFDEPGDAALPEPDAGDAQTGRPRCSTDADCGLSSLHCDTASGDCVACVTDTNCTDPGFPRCDFAIHRCVECGISTDCPVGEYCENQTRRCVPRCQDPDECPLSRPFCDKVNVRCYECLTDTDCLPLLLPRCDTAGFICVQCMTDADCGSGHRCDTPDGVCVDCLSSDDCPYPEACDPAKGRCVTP